MAVLNALLLLPIIALIKYIMNESPYVKAVNWSPTKWHVSAKPLADQDYQLITRVAHEDYRHFNDTLDRLLIPRVPESDGHLAVRQYITETMKGLDWSVEADEFTDNTPYGPKRFTNIIATLNPKACKRLVLSCHYDSKLSESGLFVGATDSAVPCAMILHIVHTLDQSLKAHRLLSSSDTTLQVIFFDGEEAFVNWSEEDSLYGSRHLAHTWNRKKFLTTDEEMSQCGHMSDMDSEIDRMEAMILLDLLGTKNPNFYSHFSDTHSLYSRIVRIEQKLNKLNLMESKTQYFHNTKSWFGGIEDDHIPFLNKGVPILHVIPTPFPDVWHKDTDNRQSLHHPTIHNLLKIFKLFVVQYLHLNVI